MGVTLWFVRIAYRRKKRHNQPPPPPAVFLPGLSSVSAENSDVEKGHDTKAERSGTQGDRTKPEPLTIALLAQAQAREDTDSSSESEDSGDDDQRYARLLGRWEFNSHIPGIRRLWEWKLYKVRQKTRHRMRRSQEEYEWDYPLSRWRRRLASVFRGRKKWRLKRRGGKKEKTDLDSDCGSEDEKAKNNELGAEHEARVKGRKMWAGEVLGRVVGWVGLEWDSGRSSSGSSISGSSSTSGSPSGASSIDGEDGQARWVRVRERARRIASVGRIPSGFRRRERNPDVEMGGVVRMVSGESTYD